VVSSNNSIDAWNQHVDGAVAIAKARGLRQLQNEQSLLLFRTVRTQMLLTSVQMRKAVHDFPGPRGWLSDVEDDQSVSYKLMQIALEIPTLLHQAQAAFATARSVKTSGNVNTLLLEAERIQQQLLELESSLPPHYGFKSSAYVSSIDEKKIDTAEAWPGPLHTYVDVNIASIRNHTRMNQILCSCVVIDALKWLDPGGYINDDRYRRARHTVQTLVDEVCYSVPFHLWGQDLGVKARPDGQNKRGQCHHSQL
jgi:hypothetical protein